MEPKCGFCDLFNEKYHCNNCKLLNRSATRGTAPKKLTVRSKSLLTT